MRGSLIKVIEVGLHANNTDWENDHLAIVALAQELGRQRVEASALVSLVDSSGGTASVASPAVVLPGVMPALVATDAIQSFSPKAGFDTAIAAIYAAQFEMQALLTSLGVVIGSPRTITGAAGTNNGTIEAITSALTGATDGTGVKGSDAQNRLLLLRNNFGTLARMVNICRVAVGLPTITDSTGGVISYNDTPQTQLKLAVIAATGTAVTTGGFSILDAAGDAILGVYRDNVATLAAAIAAVVNIENYNLGPFVIAVNRAHNHRGAADVTP